MLDSLLWLINRPQQAVFQGSKAGSEAFERLLGAGQNTFDEKWDIPVALGSAALSLPAFIAGAARGLTGTGEDVAGRDLTRGLVGEGEWSRATENALGNLLELFADPLGAITPGGRLAYRPYQAARQLKQMAPQYRSYMKTLGNPVRNVADMVKAGNYSADPVALLGAYGMKYHTAPTSTKQFAPLIAEAPSDYVPNIRKQLHPTIPGTPMTRGFRGTPPGGEGSAIVFGQEGLKYNTPAHEMGHHVRRILNTAQDPMPHARKEISKVISKRLPALNENDVPLATRQALTQLWRQTPQSVKAKLAKTPYGRLPPIAQAEELFVRSLNTSHTYPEVVPLVKKNPLLSTLGEAAQTYTNRLMPGYQQPVSWRTSLNQTAPTATLGYGQHMGQRVWEDRHDVF